MALIEQEAVKQAIFNLNSDNPYLDDVVDAVDNTPTVDAVPVVHGRWVRYHEADIGWDEYGVRCSVCKWEVENKDFIPVYNKRCPNCGAKMDRGITMPKVLTNGKIKIGAYQFSGRKKPSLCVEEGNNIKACGSFHSTEMADWFMNKIAECIGQKEGADDAD